MEDALFNVDVIYPKIYVYKAAFPNPLSFIEEAEKLPGWNPWYIMGRMLPFKTKDDRGNVFYEGTIFPSKATWDALMQEIVPDEEAISRNVQEIFFAVTSDYLSKNEMSLPNWSTHLACVCKYDTLGGAGNGLAMNYHTDYQIDREGEPGSKFALTCTMYLNDDYDGGSLLFRVTNDDKSVTEMAYKPSAGDIVVFPSAEPYLHGVEEVRSGTKYFIRTFWCYESEGSQEWHEGVETYGEDGWEKILKQRRQETKVYGAENKDE